MDPVDSVDTPRDPAGILTAGGNAPDPTKPRNRPSTRQCPEEISLPRALSRQAQVT